MKVENCSNCERVIGKLEQACVFRGNVVCQNCYQQLTDTESKQGQAAVKKPVEVKAETVPSQTEQEKSKHKVTKRDYNLFAPVITTAIVTLCLGLLGLSLLWFKINQIHKLPALSEKDVKLIEELINEINLLDAMRPSDDETVLAQLPKIQAACNNLIERGSSNYYTSIIGSLALDAEEKYIVARVWKLSGSHPQEQKSSEDDASKSRGNLVKAYRLLQDRATISEFNKFLVEDCGYEYQGKEQRDEATSK